jgi:hypothetical protein
MIVVQPRIIDDRGKLDSLAIPSRRSARVRNFFDCFQDPRLMSYRPDIIVLGFQEIVPLTAQQIVQTDPEKR